MLWLPTFTMLLVSLISYLDRNTLALLAPTILAATGLSAEQYGWVISAFSVLYMVGNPVWGSLLDRYGVQRGMLVAVSVWTIASASHAFAIGFLSLAAARAVLGFGEGATFPGSMRVVLQTLPPHLRSRGLAISYSGGSLGAIVTPLVVTPLALRFGWRSAFLFTGLAGAVWLACWIVLSRRPALAQIPVRTTVALRASDRRVWAFICAYALGAIPLGFVLYGAPLYLSRGLGASQAFLGHTLWLPPLGWECGYFAWGWIADRHATTLRGLRGWMGACTVFGLQLAAVTMTDNRAVALAILFFAMFIAAGFVVLPLAYATRTFSPDSAGLIAGLGAGSWSAAVAVIMPYLGRLFDDYQYGSAFQLAALLPLAGYGGFVLFSREPARIPALANTR